MKTSLTSFHKFLRSQTRKYTDCTRGVAALEFVLVFPLVVAVFYAVVELCNYQMIERRAQHAVDFAAEYMSRDADNVLDVPEIHIMEDLWQIVNVTSFINTGGHAYTNSRGNYARAFASVGFTQTPAGCAGAACSFEPDVAWTFLAHQGVASPVRRSCSQTLVPDDFTLTDDTLPEGVAGRSALAVADFTYKYVPILKSSFISGHERHVTAIRKTRGGQSMGTSGTSHHYIRC